MPTMTAQKSSASRKAARIASDSAPMSVTVTMSAAQYEIFAPAAKELGTDVGSLLLAFACYSIETNPVNDDPYDEATSILWHFGKRHKLPLPERGWIEGGVGFAVPTIPETEQDVPFGWRRQA